MFNYVLYCLNKKVFGISIQLLLLLAFIIVIFINNSHDTVVLKETDVIIEEVDSPAGQCTSTVMTVQQITKSGLRTMTLVDLVNELSATNEKLNKQIENDAEIINKLKLDQSLSKERSNNRINELKNEHNKEITRIEHQHDMTLADLKLQNHNDIIADRIENANKINDLKMKLFVAEQHLSNP